MRWAAYVGGSVAASAAVVLRAFHERPNFYSATVYLGQSTACRMILLNMLLLTLGSSIYGLQRLLYGPLRAIEIEQLWDKAWYAITETALAMTTFRDEVGGYFFLMFMTLLAGKVWGWIGEGRVETLEQQPPANPKTFHARLLTSLLLSETFDLLMLQYCARSILEQHPPRAGMMVMFVFEFAILAINSSSTLARYGLALQERLVIHQQTKAKIEERKEEIRMQREEERRQEIANAPAGHTVPPPEPVRDEEIDENEIDVPGWQEKGKFVLFLDLLTDFLKLIFYLGFFMILIVFAGIPIHMFRDLYLTTRSFLKRINDYLKYRNATRDMNTRYPDATPEELERDGTCIICREDMHPWQQPDVQQAAAGRAPRSPPDERRRPKKLPCGHILHVGCLRSWLERQQVCPTCRRSVLAPVVPGTSPANQAAGQDGQAHRQGENRAQGGGQDNGLANQGQAPQQDHNRPFGGVEGLRARTFNLGGMRLTFAAGNARQFRNALDNMRNEGNGRDEGNGNWTGVTDSMRSGGGSPVTGSSGTIQQQLESVEHQISAEINRLNATRDQLSVVRALEGELARLQAVQREGAQQPASQPTQGVSAAPTAMPGMPSFQPQQQQPQQQVFGSQQQQTTLGPGHPELPAGMALPEGWSMLPLQRITPDRQQQHTGQSQGAADSYNVVPQAALPRSRPTSVPPPAPAPGQAGRSNGAGGSRSGTPLSSTLAPTATATSTSTASSHADGASTASASGEAAPARPARTSREIIADARQTLMTARRPDWVPRTRLPTETSQPAASATTTTSSSDAATPSQPSNGVSSETQAHEESSSSPAPMNGSAGAREDKGKGRAPTVEEEPDPEA